MSIRGQASGSSAKEVAGGCTATALVFPTKKYRMITFYLNVTNACNLFLIDLMNIHRYTMNVGGDR